MSATAPLRWCAARFPDVPILLYHHLVAHDEPDPGAYEVSARAFRAHLDLLRAWRYEVLTLAALARVIAQGSGQGRLIAVVTFDDAYRSFAELALPELRARRMSATVFVPGADIGGANRWDRDSGQPERAIMTVGQLRSAIAEGIEVGAHGWRHRNLTACSADELAEEIHRPREELAQQLGQAPQTFAYPYGEFAPQHPPMLQAAGYAAAAAIFSAERTVTANPFAMRRIYVHPGDAPWRFACKLSGPSLRLKAHQGIPRAPSARVDLEP